MFDKRLNMTSDECIIRPLRNNDLDAVSHMHHRVWHQAYQKYPKLYAVIKNSFCADISKNFWSKFLNPSQDFSDHALVVGNDRIAYVAVLNNKIVGVAAASSYRFGVSSWGKADAFFTDKKGKHMKVAKFQNLYIEKQYRNKGLAHYLNIKRADTMIDRGYKSLFMTVYKDAKSIVTYHKRQGLFDIDTYNSLETFANGMTIPLVCLGHFSLHDMREHWHKQVLAKAKYQSIYKDISSLD